MMKAPCSDEEAQGYRLSMGASLVLASMGFIMMVAGSIDTKWMILERSNGKEPILISPWLVCVKQNCSRETTTVDIRVTQMLMVTALSLSLLLALSLVLDYLRIVSWLANHHLTLAILSFLTVFFLLLAMLILNRRLMHVYKNFYKITIFWPCYTIWVCFFLFVSSGILCFLNYQNCKYRAKRASAVPGEVQVQLSRQGSAVTEGSNSQLSQGPSSTGSTQASVASGSLLVPRPQKATFMVLKSSSGLTALPF
ncbi:transmembrane protein 225-like [Tachyglossus aculeatus]|uniref:transmembrane protein 225-like n=1 Tax=Tachyglossus aculeatus TaxID=9261 RepID=UPI0018F7B7A8|nr:transmembrane protein 225-like [Tachyglossus aculeatus]